MNLMNFFKKLFTRKKINKYNKGAEKYQSSAAPLDHINTEWQKIDAQIEQKSPSQLRQALINADKTMDNVLMGMVPGETMGERLKSAKDKFDYPTYDKLWKAHKVRNSLVHESGFEPPASLLIDSINDIRNALNKLGRRV